MGMVLSFQDTTMCNECPYSSDKLDNLVKHVALGHSKLDELLLNEQLVNEKRKQALNKPKKIHIGPQCPICDMKFTKAQNRDHVSWHFIDELREFVHSTGSNKACQQCYYTTEKMDNLVKHYALGHSKLDELLLDEKLVTKKRKEHAKKPKRLSFGPDCPICQEPGRDRDHVLRHFMTELMEMVNEMPNKKQCNQCSYKSNKREYMAKHIALFHCKLDELMAKEELVKLSQKKAAGKPKRVPMGENCVVCGMSFPQREHVARHFQDELLEITKTFDSPLSCAFCPFTADRIEYVARHVGLVHRKLDEMMCNDELIKRKASEFNSSNSLAGPTVKIEPVRKSQRQAKQVNKEPIWLQKSPLKEDTPKKVVVTEPVEEVKPKVIDEGEVDQEMSDTENQIETAPPRKKLKIDHGDSNTVMILDRSDMNFDQIEIKTNLDEIKIDQSEAKVEQNNVKVDQNEVKIDQNVVKIDENVVKIDQNVVKIYQKEVKIDKSENEEDGVSFDD